MNTEQYLEWVWLIRLGMPILIMLAIMLIQSLGRHWRYLICYFISIGTFMLDWFGVWQYLGFSLLFMLLLYKELFVKSTKKLEGVEWNG